MKVCYIIYVMKRTIYYHICNMTNNEHLVKELYVVVNKLFSETEESTISLVDLNLHIFYEPFADEFVPTKITKFDNKIHIYLNYESEEYPDGLFVTPEELSCFDLKYLISGLNHLIFKPCAGKCECNYGGMEIEINKSNDAARFRRNWGDDCLGKVTEWREIEYNEEGEPFCKLPNGDIENLNEYMCFNS